jgi:hypothetical protein
MRSNKSTIGSVSFGEGRDNPKSVAIRKITISQWQELFGVINSLPQMLMSVVTAPPSERAGYLIVALSESVEDITQVVALLTELDVEWIKQNASADELFTFFVETAKINNFGELIKNVQGVLNLSGIQPKAVEEQNAD